MVNSMGERFNVKSVYTGEETQTGGRISEVMKQYPGESFIATYGDGLANIAIDKLLNFHRSHGKLATVTAVRPPARFGYMKIEDAKVMRFGEKNQSDEGWINGGFFVLDPKVSQYVTSINEPFESGALVRLVDQSQLMAFQHENFWQPMDTLREKLELEKYAQNKTPPWLNF
jgi:glucose-1-phosphate cytidylyltransferase